MKKILIACFLCFLTLALSISAFAAYLGDVNNDGNVNASDARAILRHASKIENIADDMLLRADIDKNGNVNAADARLALRMSSKLDELIEDHIHDYKTTEIQKQDCEKDGIIEYRCSVCDHNYQEVTKATGHNYTSEVTQEPTCGVAGIKEYTCSACNHSYTEEIAAGEHDYWEVVVRDPSCATGLKEYTCANCGDVYTEEIPAISSKHIYGDFVVTKQDTCIGPGERTYTCKVCGSTKVEEFEYVDWHTYGGTYEVIKEATYNEPGENKYTCEGCGFVRIDESDPLKVKYPVYVYLPETSILVSEYNYKNKVESNFRITDLSFEITIKTSDGEYGTKVCYAGEKTYDINGKNTSDNCSVGYKLYDMEGYVIKSGTDYTTDIKIGEKVKGQEIWLGYLEPGEYRLEILDVK